MTPGRSRPGEPEISAFQRFPKTCFARSSETCRLPGSRSGLDPMSIEPTRLFAAAGTKKPAFSTPMLPVARARLNAALKTDSPYSRSNRSGPRTSAIFLPASIPAATDTSSDTGPRDPAPPRFTKPAFDVIAHDRQRLARIGADGQNEVRLFQVREGLVAVPAAGACIDQLPVVPAVQVAAVVDVWVPRMVRAIFWNR
jgi:hypothetical protein